MQSLSVIVIYLLLSAGKSVDVTAESAQCISGFRSNEILNDWAIQSKTTLDTHPHQQLYPSINFGCSGVLKRWIMKAKSELAQLNFSSYVYPELQIWRPGQLGAYTKVGSSVIDISPNQVTHIYTVIPDPPLSFQSGDIFGIWEGTNNYANVRTVDNIRPISGTKHVGTEGFNYEASSPQTSFTGTQMRSLGVPLVTVETDPPGCNNSFITVETLATYATKTTSCSSTYCLHVIPQMSFTCYGNITGWTVGASWVNTNDANIIPELQVWRKELDAVSTYTRVASVPLTPIPPENTNINGGYIRKSLFANTFNPPIYVKRGDVLGLLLPKGGQLILQMASFSHVSLPNNYILASNSPFTDVVRIDLESSRVTSTEFLQPFITLEFSRDNSIVETTYAEPQTTTTPTTTTPTTVTSPATTTDPPLTSSHTTSNGLSSPHDQTTALSGGTHLTTAVSSRTNTLESKYIFGIIVAVLLLIVLLLVTALATVGLYLYVKSRRRRHSQFVETFIDTSANEAYQQRATLLTQPTQRDRILPPNSHHSPPITTSSNVAYLTSGQSQTERENLITTVGRHNLLTQHSSDLNSIVTMSNMAYQTNNVTSIAQARDSHGDVSLPFPSVSPEVNPNGTFDMNVNASYCTDHTVTTRRKDSPQEGGRRSKEGRRTELELEASGTVMSPSTEPLPHGQDPMVKPYQVTNLPCVEFVNV